MTNRILLLVLVAVALPTLASAKTAPATRSAATLPAVKSLSPEEVKALSMDDMLKNGAQFVKDMESTVRSVLDTMAVAVKANDFTRINCVSESLTIMKGLMRLSGQNELALREQVVNRNRAGAEHEYVKLHIASQRVVQMQAQASSCGGPGGDTIFAGSPIVEREFDADLPMEEMKKVLWNWFVTIEPPPSASPFY